MARPVRRARQKLLKQGEVVGILPEEEAALTRALYASLYGEKKKSPTKPDVVDDSQDNLSTYPSLDKCGCSQDVLTPLKMKFESPSPPYECSSPFGIDSSPPSAFGHLSLSSSPIGSPGSIGSSLKLVLSTSSWSSSSSSVHSVGSDPPSPVETTPTKSVPKKRTPLKQRSDKGKGKGKLIVDSSLFSGVSPVKRQKKTPTKQTTPKPKSPKVTPISTQKKLKVTPKRSKGLKTSPKLSKSLSPKNLSTTKVPKVKSELSNRNPLSPEAATVFHDHCYFSSSKQPPYFLGSAGTSAAKDSAATASDVRDSTGKELPNSRTGSPSCIYQAQRKFAHNHMPPHSRKPAKRLGSLAKVKEIPKTEDFITYLCLRGSPNMPKKLQKFSAPWTPLKKRLRAKNGTVERVLVVRRGSVKGSKKRLNFTPSNDPVLVQH